MGWRFLEVGPWSCLDSLCSWQVFVSWEMEWSLCLCIVAYVLTKLRHLRLRSVSPQPGARDRVVEGYQGLG
jgi:hypothetical protein